MTEEAQRMVLAEADDWRDIKPWKNGDWGGWRSDWPFKNKPLWSRKEPLEHLGRIPDYLASRDAMHRAVSKLVRAANKGQEFMLHLWEVSGLQKTYGHLLPLPSDLPSQHTLPERIWLLHIVPSESHHAEAFLKTIGKWKDDE